MARLSEAQLELRAHWMSFCDADAFAGSADFPERMEASGLIELVEVDDDALDDPFAAERGIERGGLMWQLTDAGRRALADGDKGCGDVSIQHFQRRRSNDVHPPYPDTKAKE